jgi:hypothetical protein
MSLIDDMITVWNQVMPLALEIDMNDIQLMSPTPDLYSMYGPTHFQC